MTKAPRGTGAVAAEQRVSDATKIYWRAIMALLAVLVVANAAVLGWFMQREFERAERIQTNARILDVVGRTGIQVDCAVDVYIKNRPSGVDQEGLRKLTNECIARRAKALPQ